MSRILLARAPCWVVENSDDESDDPAYLLYILVVTLVVSLVGPSSITCCYLFSVFLLRSDICTHTILCYACHMMHLNESSCLISTVANDILCLNVNPPLYNWLLVQKK